MKSQETIEKLIKAGFSVEKAIELATLNTKDDKSIKETPKEVKNDTKKHENTIEVNSVETKSTKKDVSTSGNEDIVKRLAALELENVKLAAQNEQNVKMFGNSATNTVNAEAAKDLDNFEDFLNGTYIIPEK